MRLVIEFHLDAWQAHCDELLLSDQLLTRHAAARALADVHAEAHAKELTAQATGRRVTRASEYLNEIERLYKSRRLHLHEAGCYTLRFLFLDAQARSAHPKLYRSFTTRLAQSSNFHDTLILWEMLVDVACDPDDLTTLRELVEHAPFWQPIWPYFENELAECEALESYKQQRGPEGLQAAEAFERHESIRSQLKALAEHFRDEPGLLPPLRNYWKPHLFVDELRSTDTLPRESVEGVLACLSVFAIHPTWEVAETATAGPYARRSKRSSSHPPRSIWKFLENRVPRRGGSGSGAIGSARWTATGAQRLPPRHRRR